uniref:DDE Tnp4 domain-containing protein n=1 Tax=Solanum lycopersicum TaxID=4081 RepID=A0A3Q7FH25_SOLLC
MVLGALDGTYIHIRVPSVYKPRYRTRKGDIATNVIIIYVMEDIQMEKVFFHLTEDIDID